MKIADSQKNTYPNLGILHMLIFEFIRHTTINLNNTHIIFSYIYTFNMLILHIVLYIN